MKKIFALTLVLSMVLAVCPLGAFAETTSGSCGENVTWTFDSETGVLTISGEGEMTDYHYTSKAPWYEYGSDIKSVIVEAGVTSIGNYAFRDCDLKSITFREESELVSIGECAFLWCRYLESITFPNRMTSIGSEAFCDCEKITSINISERITSIGNSAFAYCDALEKITVDENNIVFYGSGNCVIEKESKTLILGCTNSIIPDEVISIGDHAFRACTNLESISIPENVTAIGKKAFEDCNRLTSITIPDSVTSIGDFAFYECAGLANITLSKNLTVIGEYAFSECTGLTSITIPESVISIGKAAFAYCYYLTSITFVEGLISIDEMAFRTCGFTSITLPKSLTSIGSSAFSYCNSLTTVYYNGAKEEWDEISIGSYNDSLLNAEIIYNYCYHNITEWVINSDNTKELTCSDCGEVLETLGADEFIPGDVNGDNKLNMFDYVAVKNACIKGSADEALLARADINGDGRVNMFDYAALKKLVMEK